MITDRPFSLVLINSYVSTRKSIHRLQLVPLTASNFPKFIFYSSKKKKKDMEISEGKFFLFWSVISVIFLKLGFSTIDDTELSKSVPPLVMFLFKHSMAIFTCYSSIHAFSFRHQINKSVNIYLLDFTYEIFVLVSFFGGSFGYCSLPIYFVTTLYNLFLIVYDNGHFASDPNYKLELFVYACYTVSATFFACLSALGPTNLKSNGYLMLSFSRYGSWLYKFEKKRRGEWLPSTQPAVHDQNLTISNGTNSNKVKKSIEFAVGLLGTIVFQNFFRINSFKEVVAFLYFAVAWLADVTLLSPSHDLGVLNFLLGNAIVGCSVSEFGLRGKTWIAYAASVFLYCLSLKIQSLSFVNRGGGNRKVILW